MKICIKCGVEKDESLFTIGKNQCKACKKEYDKNWCLKNPEHTRECNKKYRLRNPEYAKKYRLKNLGRLKEHSKEYRLKNLEREKKRKKEYRLKNPGRVKEYSKEYYLKNLERVKERSKEYDLKNPDVRRVIVARRRDRKKALGETKLCKTHIEFVRNQFNNNCFVCKATHSIRGDKIIVLSLDHHYPLSKGYPLKLGNIVLLCNSCNCSKGAKINEEYYTKEQLADLESKLKEQENFLLLEETNEHKNTQSAELLQL